MKEKNFYLTEDKELEKMAYRYMKYIHADPSLCGYQYTIYAIVFKMQNTEMEYIGEKGLYGKIAKKFHNDWRNVERGIRHLSEKLHETLSAGEYAMLFHSERKLTNRQFIQHACNFIRYESEKLKE